MALGTPTHLDAVSAANSQSSLASNSVSPSANALLLVSVGAGGSSADDFTFSIADTLAGTGSWTQVSLIATAATGRTYRLAVFYARAGSTPGSGTVTVTASSAQLRWAMRTAEVTGQAETPGAQSKTGSGTDTSLSLTLDATPAADAMVFGAVVSVADSDGITPGTNYTELGETDSGSSNNARLQTQYDLDDATTTCDWSGLNTSVNLGVAIEIVPASEGTQISVTDAGAGADAIGSVEVALALPDSGAGAESFSGTASLAVAESGSGTEAPALSVQLTLAEVGAGTDAMVMQQVLASIADVAAGSDAVSGLTVSIALADAGSGAEAVAFDVTLALADSAAGADVVSVLTHILKTVTDLALGTDGLAGLSGAVAVADGGAGGDVIAMVTVQVPVADVAAGLELVAGLTATLAVIESALGGDVVVALDATKRIVSLSITFTRRTVAFALAERGMDVALSGRSIEFTLNE